MSELPSLLGDDLFLPSLLGDDLFLPSLLGDDLFLLFRKQEYYIDFTLLFVLIRLLKKDSLIFSIEMLDM
jgi:hypothetical protein